MSTGGDMDAREWDDRYAAGRLWSEGPNRVFAELVQDLEPGRVLDLAGGEGRNGLWLAGRGWRATIVDFSATALQRGREQAAGRSLPIRWVQADVTSLDTGEDSLLGVFDLVAVLYLHLPAAAMGRALRSAAGSVAPGGRLIVLGHHPANLVEGVGGPQDPGVLHDETALSGWLGDLTVRTSRREIRVTEAGAAVDALVVASRPAEHTAQVDLPASADR